MPPSLGGEGRASGSEPTVRRGEGGCRPCILETMAAPEETLFANGQSRRGLFVRLGNVLYWIFVVRLETLGPTQQLFHLGDKFFRNERLYEIIRGAGVKRDKLADMTA